MEDILNKPALTDEVLEALDELHERKEKKMPADETGRSSIPGFRKRLFPIREGLKVAQEKYIREIPAYKDMKVYRNAFWQANPIGAVLKDYVWNSISPEKSKTDGRFQATFSPDGRVYGEYVAIKITEPNKTFHVQRLAEWFREEEFIERFRKELLNLPYNFEMTCHSGDGQEISGKVHEISDAEWQTLRNSGLDPRYYFVVARYHKRDRLRDLTVDDLGKMLVGELSELSGIYPILQGYKIESTRSTRLRITSKIRKARYQTMPASRKPFVPEFAGERKAFTIGKRIKAQQIHGLIVNTLQKELATRGFKTFRDKYRDLFIGEDRVEMLFEIKVKASTSSLYQAIGQLMLHGAAEEAEPSRVVVLPERLTPRTQAAVERMGITVLAFELKEGKAVFPGLDDILPPK